MGAEHQAAYAARQKVLDPDGWRVRRREATQRWRERNREKHCAQAAVAYAIKTGKMIRPGTCSRCEKECRPEAHHHDYEKRLDVVWLCRKCHAAETY